MRALVLFALVLLLPAGAVAVSSRLDLWVRWAEFESQQARLAQAREIRYERIRTCRRRDPSLVLGFGPERQAVLAGTRVRLSQDEDRRLREAVARLPVEALVPSARDLGCCRDRIVVRLSGNDARDVVVEDVPWRSGALNEVKREIWAILRRHLPDDRFKEATEELVVRF
ncbi:MAG: hypothetical protein L0216_16340 [Planctomycetales bacterium]|nr:hypothetical protein [Planctomycetales bacterium]